MPLIVVVAASAGRALSALAEITAAHAAGACVALPLVFIAAADRPSLRAALANSAGAVVSFISLGHEWASFAAARLSGRNCGRERWVSFAVPDVRQSRGAYRHRQQSWGDRFQPLHSGAGW